MDPLRVGKSKNHRERKNGASREQWIKRKTARNLAARQACLLGKTEKAEKAGKA